MMWPLQVSFLGLQARIYISNFPLSHAISSPGGVALHGIEGLECTELTTGSGTAGSLWGRLKEQRNNGNVIVGGYCRPSSQDNDTNKLFFGELKAHLQVNCPCPCGEHQLARS